MPETAELRDLNMKPAPVGVGDLELHRRELTGYCQLIVGASEADDAVQETMLRAWRASADFAGRSSVRAWLYRIAANTCLDLLRGRERRGRLGQRLQASAEVPAVLASPADPAEFAATQDGVRRALAAVLGQLPARQRAALILCEVLRWRSDEAAQVLGTTAAAVASSLQRARAALARQPGSRDPGNVDADQLARYQDAFRRYDIATLVGMIQAEAGQAADERCKSPHLAGAE
jgi:RNA polymerase sigma-70 factor, ECF subfamily